MNRIREYREAAGLTQERLAEVLGTANNTIWRLETGRTRLTLWWMERLAKALGCKAGDLITNVTLSERGVEPVDDCPIGAVIARRGLRVYRVTETSVASAGYGPGTTIVVDETEHAAAHPQNGDIVLVEIGEERTRVLRQFVRPSMVITNRRGANVVNNPDDPTVRPRIVGVVLRGKDGQDGC